MFKPSSNEKKFQGGAVTQEMVKELRDVAAQQDLYGMRKYGKELDPLDPKYDWLKMATEELVDLAKYVYCERVKRDYVFKLVETCILDMVEESEKAHRKRIAEVVVSMLGELQGQETGVGDHKPPITDIE